MVNWEVMLFFWASALFSLAFLLLCACPARPQQCLRILGLPFPVHDWANHCHSKAGLQSLYYLRHLRTCAAAARGSHGGQCWSILADQIGTNWVEEVGAAFDATGSVFWIALDLTLSMLLASLFAEISLQTSLPFSSMVWQAAIASNPALAMAGQALLCGSSESAKGKYGCGGADGQQPLGGNNNNVRRRKHSRWSCHLQREFGSKALAELIVFTGRVDVCHLL